MGIVLLVGQAVAALFSILFFVSSKKQEGQPKYESLIYSFISVLFVIIAYLIWRNLK